MYQRTLAKHPGLWWEPSHPLCTPLVLRVLKTVNTLIQNGNPENGLVLGAVGRCGSSGWFGLNYTPRLLSFRESSIMMVDLEPKGTLQSFLRPGCTHAGTLGHSVRSVRGFWPESGSWIFNIKLLILTSAAPAAQFVNVPRSEIANEWRKSEEAVDRTFYSSIILLFEVHTESSKLYILP